MRCDGGVGYLVSERLPWKLDRGGERGVWLDRLIVYIPGEDPSAEEDAISSVGFRLFLLRRCVSTPRSLSA